MQENLIDYYARRAAEYEQVYQKPERQQDLAQLRSYLGSAFPGMRVLEIACGTGYWTACIAEAAREIVATDVNEEVLDIARRKAYGSARVHFTQADLYALEAAPRPFEAAFGGFIWSHIPLDRLPEMLASLHASLVSGARVILIDNRYVAGNSTPIAHTDAAGNTYQDRRLADGSLHRVLKNFPTDDALFAQLQPLARDIEIRHSTYYWRVSYRVN